MFALMFSPLRKTSEEPELTANPGCVTQFNKQSIAGKFLLHTSSCSLLPRVPIHLTRTDIVGLIADL